MTKAVRFAPSVMGGEDSDDDDHHHDSLSMKVTPPRSQSSKPATPIPPPLPSRGGRRAWNTDTSLHVILPPRRPIRQASCELPEQDYDDFSDDNKNSEVDSWAVEECHKTVVAIVDSESSPVVTTRKSGKKISGLPGADDDEGPSSSLSSQSSSSSLSLSSSSGVPSPTAVEQLLFQGTIHSLSLGAPELTTMSSSSSSRLQQQQQQQQRKRPMMQGRKKKKKKSTPAIPLLGDDDEEGFSAAGGSRNGTGIRLQQRLYDWTRTIEDQQWRLSSLQQQQQQQRSGQDGTVQLQPNANAADVTSKGGGNNADQPRREKDELSLEDLERLDESIEELQCSDEDFGRLLDSIDLALERLKVYS